MLKIENFDLPEFNLSVSDETYKKGSVAAVKATHKLIKDKLQEYGSISDDAYNCLYTFAKQYFIHFEQYLEAEISLEKTGNIPF
jgi:hypothetical protein